MHRKIKIAGYGVVMWLIPFLVSLLIYPIKVFANPLFESIMPVIITITVVLLSAAYFKGMNENFFNEGIIIGLLWFLLSIIIDLLLFIPPSPMQMSFINYMMDIGITYLIIPVITVGFGYIIQNKY
jgi:hypothetical protein